MSSSTSELENNEESASSEEDKILDLDELVEPIGEFIINKERYRFVQMGLLGLLEQKTIDNLWNKIQEIRKLNKPTPTQEETYGRSLRRILPMISDMPAEAVQEADLPKLLSAVMYFFSVRTASQVALVVRMATIHKKQSGQSIGENSSLDSIISSLKPTPESG